MSEKQNDPAFTILFFGVVFFGLVATLYWNNGNWQEREIQRLEQQAQQYEGYQRALRDLR